MDASTSHVVTAGSQARTTYYGQPVIKAPHWHWLIVNYFFFGALTGGSFVMATVADLSGRHPAVVRVGRYLSFAALLPCPPLLILDLGRPERFVNMLRIIKLRSVMSLGSWALTGLGIFGTLAAGLQLIHDLTGSTRFAGLHRAAGLLGLPFAIFVSGYTGLLLAVTNVPLWARNSLLMGPTFVSSAFSGSLSAISLILHVTGQENRRTATALARAEATCIAVEVGLLSTGLFRLGRLGRPLTAGRYGLLFWPLTVVAGLLVPLGLHLSGPVQGRDVPQSRRTLAALVAIGGGYTLRMLMLFAGKESARRPEDYFELTRGRG